jgi:hypothetical protein
MKQLRGASRCLPHLDRSRPLSLVHSQAAAEHRFEPTKQECRAQKERRISKAVNAQPLHFSFSPLLAKSRGILAHQRSTKNHTATKYVAAINVYMLRCLLSAQRGCQDRVEVTSPKVRRPQLLTPIGLAGGGVEGCPPRLPARGSSQGFGVGGVCRRSGTNW